MRASTLVAPTVPGGRRARRKAELRERILRAALDIIARQGFFATTVEQITEAADVGKGTFFNYFPSKEHALAGFGEMQVARVRAAHAEAQAGQRPARDILERLLMRLAEEPGRSQALVRSMMVANLSSEAVRHLFRRNLGRGRRLLAEIIAYGQDRGEIESHHTPIDLARALQQMFMGTILLWAVFPPSRLTDRLKPNFEIFWSGIAAEGKTTPRKGRT